MKQSIFIHSSCVSVITTSPVRCATALVAAMRDDRTLN